MSPSGCDSGGTGEGVVEDSVLDRRNPSVRERLTKLDELLRSGRPNSLEGLASALGKTPRTICRDLQFLKIEVGLPIGHDAERGYFIEFHAPPLEADFVSRGSGGIGPAGGRRKDREEILRTLHGALCDRVSVTLSLEAGAAASVEKWKVHPYFLSRMDGEFILFARRPEDGALVNVPLHRIRGAILEEETFSDAAIPGARLKEREGWVPSGTLHHVSLRFLLPPDWVPDLRIAAGQAVEAAVDGGLVIRFATDDLEAAGRLVFLLGDTVLVEGPEPLKSAVRSQRKHAVGRGRS